MLTEQGYDVTVFERFESPRPVGSGIILQPTGLAVLEDLGLDADIHALGHRIDRIHGVTMPSRRQVLNVDYSVLGDDQWRRIKTQAPRDSPGADTRTGLRRVMGSIRLARW